MLNEKDKELAKKLGIEGIDEDQQAIQLQLFRRSLQKKVGMAIEDTLSDKQLEEFEKLYDNKDSKALESWLHRTVPDYEKLIANEESDMIEYVKKSAENYRSILRSVTE